MKPFKDELLYEKIEQERDKLLEYLEKYDMEDSERRFIIKKIQNISEKLLEKANYAKNKK